MLRRIRTTPDFVKSPPLSNILMNLNVEQLQEVLIEIVSWDSSGKDIFDCDYLFDDPIRGIPDLTISEYDGAERIAWIHSNPMIKITNCSHFIAKILLASKTEPDFFLVAFGLIRNQVLFIRPDEEIYDMLIGLKLLHFFTLKYGHKSKMDSLLDEIKPHLPSKLINYFESFITRYDKFQKREKNELCDVEVLYMDILFNTLDCTRCLQTERIRSSRNFKLSTHTLELLIHRFSVHQANLKGKTITVSSIGDSSELSNWHKNYLEQVLEIGRILFVGILKCNLDRDTKFPR